MTTAHKVTMTSIVAIPASDVHPQGTAKHEAIDFVTNVDLEAYVNDAKRRWQRVEVSDEPYEVDDYTTPAHLDLSGANDHRNPGESF